ncbi:MAG: GNAT family N-acetyltransferase [Sedimentisphaerales bacterium]|nr:GNAT family N-acetyltransferase [Sedimentisphaerales bacterium]
MATYIIAGENCQIVSLDSQQPSIGICSALVDSIKRIALQSHCKKIWLTTTNDNLNALRFYQKRGFVFVKIHRNAIDLAREHKSIPEIEANGVYIRDEIELEMALEVNRIE